MMALARASSNCSLESHILRQVRAALSGAATVEDVAGRLIDDRFVYARQLADFAFHASDAHGVERMASKLSTAHQWPTAVPIYDIQASGLNTSALCAFLTVAVPVLRHSALIDGFVLLSLGSASFGSPWHPSITNRLDASCGSALLTDLLFEPKLRAWFVSQHYPLSSRHSTSTTPSAGDPAVGDIDRDVLWLMHAKLHHVPLGLPHIFSKFGQRERAWLGLHETCRRGLLYINFKPRPYRTSILESLRPHFGALSNDYIGKARLRLRDAEDTKNYVVQLATHKFVLSPPGSGIDCYRHYEALLCGAIPIVEYTPLAVELLAGLPAIFVRNWHRVTPDYLLQQYNVLRSLTFDFRRLTTAYWRNELLAAKQLPPFRSGHDKARRTELRAPRTAPSYRKRRKTDVMSPSADMPHHRRRQPQPGTVGGEYAMPMVSSASPTHRTHSRARHR